MQERIIRELFYRGSSLPYEGSGMERVPVQKGVGFFPGCSGLFSEFTNDPRKRVMILGQDFGTKDYYEGLGKEGEIDTSVTCRQLGVLLADLGIKKEDCFLTNIFMGLRTQGKMIGPSAPANASSDNPFLIASKVFLREQIEIVRPDLVIVLGKHPAQTLAKWWPRDFGGWRDMLGITKPFEKNRFYSPAQGLHQDAIFADFKIRFLFALHPSMSNTHRGLIWGKGNNGRAKEVALLKTLLPEQ
jgi:uracil-DNA glycosylase family 4